MVLCSIVFVWVVRYQNIIEEFKHYHYPNWLRDLVGILKISFAVLMLSTDSTQVIVGSAGIAVLMIAALFTHLKVKNPPEKMLPAFMLLLFSGFILFTQI
jgi:hypothetical protein